MGERSGSLTPSVDISQGAGAGLIGAMWSEAVSEWVQAKFSAEQMVDGYERLYQEIVRK